MKIRSVEAELFHVGGQSGRHGEANGRFSQFSQRAYVPRERGYKTGSNHLLQYLTE
jgi:hypothetical protein